MKIFIKYVIACMTEKKGRFLLLLIAIALSTGLVVASTGLIDIVLDSFINPMLATYEERDISIQPRDYTQQFFSCDQLDTSSLKKGSLVRELYLSGNISDNAGTDNETLRTIQIRGRETDSIDDSMIMEGSLDDFSGEQCIISKRTAKERKLSLHDKLSVIIAGQTYELKIVAIYSPEGLFYNDTKDSFSILLPYEYLSGLLGMEGRYNQLTATSKDGNLKETISAFNKANPDFKADKLFDIKDVKEQFAGIQSILYALLLIVVIMSSVIIYSTFKLIITERMEIIGTFLSQGATTGKVKLILRMESLMYGIVGAIVGNVLGVLALSIIARKISPLSKYGVYEAVNIRPYYIISGTLFAILLSLISSYFPVRRISKLQVKEVILNDVRISMSIGYKKFIVGVLIILASVICLLVLRKDLGLFSLLLLLISAVGLILAYPKCIDLVSRGLVWLFRDRNKSLFFAANNLRTSKVLLGNITLIIISMLSVISITSVAQNIVKSTVDAYKNIDYDISISGISNISEVSGESVAAKLGDDLVNLGVKREDLNFWAQVYGLMYLKESDQDYKGIVMEGINPETYVDYNKYIDFNNKEYKDDFETFKSDPKGVVMSTSMAKQTGKKIGDKVYIQCNNGTKAEVTIDMIIDERLYQSGYVVFVKLDTLKELFDVNSANALTFTTDEKADKMEKKIKPLLRQIGASCITKEDSVKQNLEANKMMMNALSIFSYLAVVIAAIGIINNISISFIQRKVEFAVLSSTGMDNSLRRRIIFIESFASVTWALLFTFLYCFLGIPFLDIMLANIGFSLNLTMPYQVFPVIYVISLIIVLLATLPAVNKSRKLSIIEEIKYE